MVLGIFIIFFLLKPSMRSLWMGSLIAAVGALVRIWAAGHIDKGRVLTQGGPYAFTRNPLYLGSFVIALGVIIAGQGYLLLPAFGAFFAIFYYPVMKAEEQELQNGYGDRFVEYSRRVPLFFPSFRGKGIRSSEFLWARVIRNREHHALAGLILAVVLLILRTLLNSP